MRRAVQIRRAEPEDVDRVVELNRHVQGVHSSARPDFFNPPDEMPGAAGFFQEVLETPDRGILLAEAEGDVVGYVLFDVQRRPPNPFTRGFARVYVEQISVAPECQRHGVGRALMEGVTEVAKAEGITLLTLDTWDFNEAAQRFFADLGFATYNLRMAKELGGDPQR